MQASGFGALGLRGAGEASELDAAGEALRCEDAEKGAVFDDGKDAAGAEGGCTAEGVDELFGGLGEGERAVHGGLEIAVAIELEARGEGVAGDRTDEAVAADDGEDVVEAVCGLCEGAAECVGAGEEGELGEHDGLIFAIIRDLNTQGTTVMLVEQNAHMALGVANRGYVLETGIVTVADSAAALLNNDEVKKAYLGE